jgi:hypothetical protein
VSVMRLVRTRASPPDAPSSRRRIGGMTRNPDGGH